MKEPLRTRYAPGYDLFKLIVAVILTVILIVLLLLALAAPLFAGGMGVSPPCKRWSPH
ncbi:MAG TPA: hypothetical protein PLF42_03920 [Anaerolineales bacterium]|nr:hypothetical protein [Anaerolineales bacterium]